MAEETLRKDRDDRDAELRRLKSRIDEKQRESDDLASKNKELKRAIATGEQNSSSEIDTLTSKLRAANLKNSELENELRIKRGASANLQERLAEIEELKNTDAALRSQLRNAREEIENLYRDLDKLRIVNTGLEGQQKELATINAVLRDKNREIDDLERKILDLQQANKDLKLKLIETEQSITKSRVNTEAVELAKEIETLRQYMRAKDDEIKRLHGEILELLDVRRRSEGLEDEIASLKRQVEKIISQRDRLKLENEDIKKAMEETSLLKFKIDELTFKLIALQNEVEIKEKKVAFFEEENASLQARLKQLKNVGEAADELRTELLAMQEEMTRLGRIVEEKNNQIELVNSQMRQLKDKVDLSTAERDKMKKLEREINQKNEEIDNLIQNMKELQLQFEELKREMEDSNQSERLREELNRLTRSYNQLEAQSSAKLRQSDDQLSELRRSLAAMEESKLILIRDHRVEMEKMQANQRELEKAVKAQENINQGYASINKADIAQYETQINDLRSRLAKSEVNRTTEVGELRQKVAELQRQLADERNGESDRDRNRSRYDDESIKVHKVIDEYLATIDAKNAEIAALKSQLASGERRLHSFSTAKKESMTPEEKEELMQELCLLREKLAQREEFNERNEREIKKLKSELQEASSSAKRSAYDRTGNSASHVPNRTMTDDSRQESEHMLSLISKRDATERDLRRQIINLQKELDDTRRGLSSSKDGTRTMSIINREALTESRYT